MAWTPNPREPSAVFEGPIIENTLAIFIRDFKGALDYYYPTEAALASTDPLFLRDFDERALGQVLGNAFPCLAITPRSNPTTEADDRSHLVEAARVNIYIGVTDDGADTVTKRIMKYVRAADAILRSARRDFFANMSNPFEVVLDIVHTYGPVGGPEESIYFRAALVELTVNLRER